MENPQIKAWIVHDPEYEHSAVVFAETRGKAKQICVLHEDLIGEVEFLDVEIRRLKKADKFYRGNPYMDWYDTEEQLNMIKELGFACVYDSFDPDECKRCDAKEYCWRYQEWLERHRE